MTTPELTDEIGYRLFKRVADLSFDAVTVTRAAHGNGPSEIVYVNDAFTEMTGYQPNEVIGATPGVLQGPKTDPAVLERLERQVRNGEMFHGKTVNYRKDGSEFEIEWKVMPLAVYGTVTHYLAVQRDVSST